MTLEILDVFESNDTIQVFAIDNNHASIVNFRNLIKESIF